MDVVQAENYYHHHKQSLIDLMPVYLQYYHYLQVHIVLSYDAAGIHYAEVLYIVADLRKNLMRPGVIPHVVIVLMEIGSFDMVY